MSDGAVTLLDGNTFLVSTDSGDIEATLADPAGLFSFDTRYLSTWVLTVDGMRLSSLSVDDVQYFETRFFLVPGAATVYVNAELSVLRHRTLSSGLVEDVTVINHGEDPADVCVRVDAGSDFADLFDVKNATAKKGTYLKRVEDDHLVLGYQRETFHRETVIRANQPAQIDEHGLTFTVHIEPGQEWSTRLQVEPIFVVRGRSVPLVARGATTRTIDDMAAELHRWLEQAPTLETDWEPLKRTYQRSLTDLAALRFRPAVGGGDSMPAAGLPWFMTMFGRDSIITSLQTVPFLPELAATTIRVLARWQGSNIDDFRDEDPGRILHEIRYGETAAFGEQPHSPYYGTADATALFVILLDEYERWSGDATTVRQFEHAARAAITWIDEYADLMGNGYVSYQRRNEQTGLENQCWKDSLDSISYRDGRLPGFPRATCELQGYTYDAKRRAARLARQFWNDPDYAARLERDAADLKRRFNRDFWLEDRQYYAVALAGPGADRVDALSSNIGHLLGSGIVDEDKAEAVVTHLMSPAMYSGWGVRTLATTERRYNPVGYHIGTVWPFENSFIAWGLRRYGFNEEAARIASGILDAATYFQGRLPEAFAGYPRERTRYPVEYPTACSPQAWSSGTPLLLLRTMLGIEPVDENMVTNPAIPAHIGHLQLLDIPGRWGYIDAYGRGRDRLTHRRRMGPPDQK
ncbi:amylo-alpha-1,6-glucosidase [Micromonospora palomenae]|uniref:amylo-alpha-1,6-glucosidase n=1 Tax=Micromonospora palomenae TaxID=1461247 RepID=UPI003F8CBD17